jgi:Mg-chelatase subunit ChlD
VSPSSPERFRIVASFIAGRSLDIAEAPAGQSAHTNGRLILVSAGAPVEQQRREVLVQSALLGAGSLDVGLLKGLRGRPSVARRYLALEGRRVLRDLADRLPGTDVNPDEDPATATADESLDLARTRRNIADAPPWFGALRPSLLLRSPGDAGSSPNDGDMRLEFTAAEPAEDDEDNESDDPTQRSKILKIFETPVVTTDAVANFLRKILGSSRSEGSSDTAGSEMQIRSVRRTPSAGPNARPLPTRIRFIDDGKPGAAVGIGGALHPEWDVFGNRYRPDWCRVIAFPLTSAADVSSAGVTQDDVLRRRLSRIGLGPKVLRARPDGDELDIEALIDLFVDLRSGYSPPEHVYTERRKLARHLGVLILLDASGSATDTDSEGLAVHEHQRRAAATLAATLEELGDRVAVYAFRSHGRHAVHLPAIKTFDQRFGAVGRARLNQLRPSGYTRLGAGIRGAGEILKNDAGTPNRLLVVLSDGFPYDDGYEGHYAEADANKALEELRTDGVACLCLSIGSDAATDALERVFGSAGHASAAVLADLSPRMDELFLGALRELAVPR